MTKNIFVQPFTVNGSLADQCGNKVVVLDVAFNAGIPAGEGTLEQQFAATTGAFIDALGGRLALWLDHHPHKAWPQYSKDSRFVLMSRNLAPACPPLIKPDMVKAHDGVDTVVAHGDFDGIMSAIKFSLGGREPYSGADADSIAADSRIGLMSATGIRLEQAMKADLRDDSIRHAIFAELVRGDPDATLKINAACTKYAAVQAETQRLASGYTVCHRVAHLDITDAGRSTFDLTALLLAGQELADVAVVRHSQNGRTNITVAGPRGWDFVKIFGLAGGMPNRVSLADGDILGIIETINNS